MTTVLTKKLEHATLIFRNFSGKPRQYNPGGLRSFGVLIDASITDDMIVEGWNIKTAKENVKDKSFSFLLIALASETVFLPRVNLNGKFLGDIAKLDTTVIEDATLEISGKFWEFGERSGYKAYMETLELTSI